MDLVGGWLNPSETYESQLRWLFPIDGNKMFQTTNQMNCWAIKGDDSPYKNHDFQGSGEQWGRYIQFTQIGLYKATETWEPCPALKLTLLLFRRIAVECSFNVHPHRNRGNCLSKNQGLPPSPRDGRLPKSSRLPQWSSIFRWLFPPCFPM